MNVKTEVRPPAFCHALRVRYHEADLQGIVFHSRYLEYFDVAMTEFLRDLGWDYRGLTEAKCDLVIIKTTLEFQHPAHADEQVFVIVQPERVGQSSFALGFVVERAADRTPLCKALTIYVNKHPQAKQLGGLPGPLKTALQERLAAGQSAEPG